MMTRRTFALASLSSLVAAKWSGASSRPVGRPRLGAVDPKGTTPTLPEQYRPQVHYSPFSGFMNDPNGLVFANGEYHLFYQYNPFQPKAGHVHWGHAVSRDLLHWTALPIALRETPAGQAFSGSAVLDVDDSSGLFNGAKNGLIAVYTRASATKQVQELAFSRDGGRTFHEFWDNPVLDVGSDSFRDPKILWHQPTKRWIMAVVRARQHRVVFYGSSDLKEWTEISSFGEAGVLGIDYECPDLVEVPVEGGGTKWVLFVSINPGAPQGGSAQQYFVGEFDGTRFTPDDTVTRFADFGKDFYALQTYSNLPTQSPVAIAWMSNWQYCNYTPTGSWRGVMSLPRHLSLRRRGQDWRLVQSPQELNGLHDRQIVPTSRGTGPGILWAAPVPPGAALEIKVRLQLEAGAIATVRFANDQGERLDVGYDANAAQIFVDRGGAHGFRHHFFTDKCAVALAPNTRELELHLIFDRCTLEVFVQGGEAVGSLLHFFETPANQLQVVAYGQATLAHMQTFTLKAALPPQG